MLNQEVCWCLNSAFVRFAPRNLPIKVHLCAIQTELLYTIHVAIDTIIIKLVKFNIEMLEIIPLYKLCCQ